MAAASRETEESGRTPSLLGRIVLLHFGAFAIFISWAFGGQSPWARQVIAWWGTAGMLLFVWAAVARPGSGRGLRHPAIRLLWPLWLYDALVIASCLNPGFRELNVAGELSLVLANPRAGWPSAAIPRLAAHELWQFNGIILSCFNLLLVLSRRSQVRAVLFLLAGNAVVLAVFGTFQQLTGADGLWFGLVHSPNQHFFATFVYHNHWGAFTVLSTAICLGLLFHFHRRGGHRDVWHSPLLLGGVVTLLLAASVPLSTSRSCTVLTAVLLASALVHLLLRVIRRRRERHESAAVPAAGIILAAVIAAGAITYLGRDVIAQRSQLTSEQLARLSQEGTLTSRLVLYRDTWRMAAEKPWFGWGLESYARVFRIFNTQRTTEVVFWIPFYAEAHNDWLQSLAEVGFVGTGLLVLLGVVPLWGLGRRALNSLLPRYLLTGCGLVLLYAWLEFPFANPAVVLLFCSCWYLAVRYLELDAPHE
jgi:O-antigen ligase